MNTEKSDSLSLDNNKNIDNNFDNLIIYDKLLKGVYLYGFTSPSKIQIKGISSINTGNDCILQSQSGTGKTATYLLGVMNRLDVTNNNICQGIIITPTRELANQVYEVALCLSKFTDFKIVKCTGGTNINDNKNDLKESNLIIGTLGRLYHMITEKKIYLDKLKFIVLDEADEILSDGISDKLQDFFNKSLNLKNNNKEEKSNIQVILISATMSLNVFNASKKFTFEPIKILLKNTEIIVDLISQFYLDIEIEDQKFDTLLDLYNLISTSQAIIFCNTIRKVECLETRLKENNFAITAICSNMTQYDRDEIVKNFRSGDTRILLTTDLLSRGIDIPHVNMVINYDLPPNKETYIHRIGRCGRFDKKGVAISLVKTQDPIDIKIFNKLKHFYKMNIDEMPDSIDKYL
jgi:superfamily II DNA/RNA helicase